MLTSVQLHAHCRTEGVTALYQGLAPGVLGASVSWGMYFYLYNVMKRAMGWDVEDSRAVRPIKLIAAASMAGMFSVVAGLAFVVVGAVRIHCTLYTYPILYICTYSVIALYLYMFYNKRSYDGICEHSHLRGEDANAAPKQVGPSPIQRNGWYVHQKEKGG